MAGKKAACRGRQSSRVEGKAGEVGWGSGHSLETISRMSDFKWDRCLKVCKAMAYS